MDRNMKRRIFHIVTHFDIGGSETVAVNISKANAPDYEFHFVEVVRGHGDYSDAFIEDLEKHHILYHRSPITANAIIGAFLFPFWFWRLHKKYHPDVYHTHTESPDVALFLFFHLFFFLIDKKTKVIRTLHNTKIWKKKRFIGYIVEHFFLRHQSNVAISGPVKEKYLADYSFYNKELPVIFNGLEEKQPQYFGGIQKDKVNILFAGRIVPQKGIKVLTKVIQELNKNPNNLFFHIVGEGPLKDYLVCQLDGFENVRYYGNVYGLASYLNAFDYLFMPSEYEGLSMLAIESSFARLPIIINSCEGLVDTVPESWPLKVIDNNVEDYLRILDNLNDYDRTSLGNLSYDFVSKRFSIKQMQDKYLCLYSSKLHKSKNYSE